MGAFQTYLALRVGARDEIPSTTVNTVVHFPSGGGVIVIPRFAVSILSATGPFTVERSDGTAIADFGAAMFAVPYSLAIPLTTDSFQIRASGPESIIFGRAL